MSQLQISLFGTLSCAVDNDPVIGLESRRAQELLGFLALHRRPQRREAVAVALWGDRPDQQAKKGLRQALWLLQSALQGSTARTGEPFLLCDGDMIGFHPQADLWVDAGVMETAYFRLQASNGLGLNSTQVGEVCSAVKLYHGDLLEGWYDDWCIPERERHQHMYLGMLDKLMDYYEAAGDYQAGLDCGLLVLQHDRAREKTHRRQMRLYYLNGERTLALQQYDACVQALHDELGVAPARSTKHLYEQISSDRFDDVTAIGLRLGHMRYGADEAGIENPIEDLLKIKQELERLHKAVVLVIDSLTHSPTPYFAAPNRKIDAH